jgi:tetratricopeptide (TPR) repeat protein
MKLPWNRLILACLALASPGLAQEPEKDSWNGIKVVTRYARPLRDGDRIVEAGTRFRVYTVKKVEDERVRVSSGDVEGWFFAGEVIPLKDAVAFYTEELTENPRNTSARNWRGIIRRELGDIDGAIEDYTEAIRHGSDGPHPLNNRGLAWMVKKDYDKAIEDFDAAILIDPKHAMAHTNRGMARRKKLDYPGALTDLNEALRLEPDSRSALNEKAWLLATCPDDAIRDAKEAVTAATKASELTAWKDANLIDTLAAAYAELGFFEQATRYQQEAIDKAPSGSPARKTYASRLALYRKKKPYREP